MTERSGFAPDFADPLLPAHPFGDPLVDLLVLPEVRRNPPASWRAGASARGALVDELHHLVAAGKYMVDASVVAEAVMREDGLWIRTEDAD